MGTPKKAKTGRPSLYTPALALSICDHVANGTPVHIIATLPGMPCERTIYEWLSDKEEFAQDYTRAREALAHRFAAEVIAIADGAPETIKGVEKAALRTRNRIWAAERMAPKKYGARLALAGDGDSPLKVVISGDDAKL